MKLRLFIVLILAIVLTGVLPAREAVAGGAFCHIVKPGENLTLIAQYYGVSTTAIIQANGLANPNLIYVGQCLLIPQAPPKPSTGCVNVHIVRRGEYLSVIAARYRVSVYSIVQANNLRNANLIYVGQRLRIPCTTSKPPTPTPSTGPWLGKFWANRDLSGNPKFSRNYNLVDFNWGTGGPGSGVGADNFSARFTRTRTLEAGKYRFNVQADDGVRVFVDGELIIDQWHLSSLAHYTADRQLAAGNHKFQVDYFENTGTARVKFWVDRIDAPPPSNAWLAEYFGNRMFEGSALLSRLEPKIDYDWGTGPPIPNFRTDDFAVRWTRTIYFKAGDYRFTATVDDGVEILIDGNPVLSEWHDSNGATYNVDVHLTEGNHRVRVKYYEAGGFAKIKFSYAPKLPLGSAFTGEYFNNTSAQGLGAPPVLVRQDNVINFDWGNKSPAAGVTADYFSVEWDGNFYFPAGVYRFTATMDDGMQVWLDQVPIIDAWHDGSVRTIWVDVAVTEGTHWVRVHYYERAGVAVAKLNWTKK